MKVEVIQAKPHHCGLIVHGLRDEHRRALDGSGRSVHKELRSLFDGSVVAKTLLIDGRVVAIGGINGTIASSFAFAWMAMTDDAKKYPSVVARQVKKHLVMIMRTREELATTVLLGDKSAMRFAIFLGFHVDHDGEGSPARGRVEREKLFDFLNDGFDGGIQIGDAMVIPMGYHDDQEGASSCASPLLH